RGFPRRGCRRRTRRLRLPGPARTGRTLSWLLLSGQGCLEAAGEDPRERLHRESAPGQGSEEHAPVVQVEGIVGSAGPAQVDAAGAAGVGRVEAPSLVDVQAGLEAGIEVEGIVF